MLFLLLARCAAFMATPVVTSRRPDPQDDFPSTLSVLSTWGTSIRLPLEDLDCSRSAPNVFYAGKSAVRLFPPHSWLVKWQPLNHYPFIPYGYTAWGTPIFEFWETANLAAEKTSGSRVTDSAGLAHPPAEVPLSTRTSSVGGLAPVATHIYILEYVHLFSTHSDPLTKSARNSHHARAL
ncbi:hypothetical protein DPMN_194212 [Dreissena polymorpha]|uniref:Secreted protein n=1 Tax=Dreissena polymorpha TaxID=45954 RepID=A0A9D3Y3W0_DREPO|nr:hypothetical protein DPMN_194212 [Dreissena polymorpha]